MVLALSCMKVYEYILKAGLSYLKVYEYNLNIRLSRCDILQKKFEELTCSSIRSKNSWEEPFFERTRDNLHYEELTLVRKGSIWPTIGQNIKGKAARNRL
jgi:hypothetical protein